MEQKVAHGWRIVWGTREVATAPSIKDMEVWINRIEEPSSLHMDNGISYVNVIGGSNDLVVVNCWPDKKNDPRKHFILFNLNFWDDDSENEESETIEINVSDQVIDYDLYEVVTKDVAIQAVIEFIFENRISAELGWRLYDYTSDRYVLPPIHPN